MDIKGDGVVSKAEFLASGGTLQLEREERQQIISEAIALDMTHREGKDERTSLLQLLTKQLSPARLVRRQE